MPNGWGTARTPSGTRGDGEHHCLHSLLTLIVQGESHCLCFPHTLMEVESGLTPNSRINQSGLLDTANNQTWPPEIQQSHQGGTRTVFMQIHPANASAIPSHLLAQS